MKLFLNSLGLIFALGIWLGSGYFYFIYDSNFKIKISIVIIITMLLFLNTIVCIALKFASQDVVKLTKIDYILTFFFGIFGCFSARNKILEKSLEQAKNKSSEQV